jgi:hypothetical protein
MTIRGAEGMSEQQLAAEIQSGAKIVVFQYCISVVILSFKRTSDPVLIRRGDSPFVKSLPWTLLTLTFGWWGIPWGFIYTPWALIVNMGGGKDVTSTFVAQLGRPAQPPQLAPSHQYQQQPGYAQPQLQQPAPVLAPAMSQPAFAPGSRVRVYGADGQFYPGTLVGVQQGYARVAFDGGREDWVPLPSVSG